MRVLPESFRKCLSAEDREKLNQHTIEEIRVKYGGKLEKDLHNQIIAWLNLHEIFFVHSRMDKKTRNAVGTPDFCIAWKNYFVAVECKIGDEQLSKEQMDAFSAITKQGGLCYVVRTFDQFLAIFK